MLTSLLERGSWVIAKLGMPLVFFYHLIIASTFLNTAADDGSFLEKVANTVLIPTQYFFEGKLANSENDGTYTLTRRFSYDDKFFLKTAASAAALPVSITVGSALKSIAYLSPTTRDRAARIHRAQLATHVTPTDYASLGLAVNDFRTAPHIDPPKFEKAPGAKHRLEADLHALKEIVRHLSAHNIPFWLDCGSCLGTYQYGGAIPHDWDIDIGVLLPDFENVKNALHNLDPDLYIVQDWSGRARPNSYLKVYVRETGGMIDLYHFALDPETNHLYTYLSNEHNIFIPKSWKIREQRYCTPMPYSYVFPLKKATFEGIEVPVPGNTEAYLQVFYGENLAPARLYNPDTDTYEKDESHPYWQLPHAH